EVWPGCRRALVRELPGYEALASPSAGGHARGGLVIFVRRDGDWSPEASSVRFRRFSLSAPPLRIWEGDGMAGKGAPFAKLAGRDGAGSLWIVCTHLQSRYRSDSYPAIRFGQVEELSSWLASLGDESPILVAGDFNTPPADERVFPALVSLGIDVTREA